MTPGPMIQLVQGVWVVSGKTLLVTYAFSTATEIGDLHLNRVTVVILRQFTKSKNVNRWIYTARYI